MSREVWSFNASVYLSLPVRRADAGQYRRLPRGIFKVKLRHKSWARFRRGGVLEMGTQRGNVAGARPLRCSEY